MMLCMFGISCELMKLGLHQQKLETNEFEHMLCAAEVVLQINND